MNSMVDPTRLKSESEVVIRNFGGEICDHLPVLDITSPRQREAIAGRAVVLNGILQIHFGAPTDVVKRWIEKYGFASHLSKREAKLIEIPNDDLSSQQLTDAYWNIEALWALLWVGSMIDDLPFDQPIGDAMASLCPELHNDQDPAKFANEMVIRNTESLFSQLDLHYRLHWWAKHPSGDKESVQIDRDIILERRKALEWVLDNRVEWDEVDLST